MTVGAETYCCPPDWPSWIHAWSNRKRETQSFSNLLITEDCVDVQIKKRSRTGSLCAFISSWIFPSEALKVKLTHSFSHIWFPAFYLVSVAVLFVVHCRAVTDRSCMREEEEALHASVICSAVTTCRWRHRSRLPLHQLLPALLPLPALHVFAAPLQNWIHTYMYTFVVACFTTSFPRLPTLVFLLLPAPLFYFISSQTGCPLEDGCVHSQGRWPCCYSVYPAHTLTPGLLVWPDGPLPGERTLLLQRAANVCCEANRMGAFTFFLWGSRLQLTVCQIDRWVIS